MALEGKYFSLDVEPEKRGEGAWGKGAALKHSVPSRMLDPGSDTTVPAELNNGTRKRRLRRTGSQIAQEGIWEGILGVTDTQPFALPHERQSSSKAVNTSFNVPTPIAEEHMTDGFGTDMRNPIGLFEGMIFYTWGFSDKKVVQYFIQTNSLERSSCGCDYEEFRSCICEATPRIDE